MYKKGLFICFGFVACFAVAILMNSLGYKKIHLIFHGRKWREKFEKVFHQYLHRNRMTFSGRLSDDNTTIHNTSQARFRILDHVIRNFRDKFDGKKLQKESAKINATKSPAELRKGDDNLNTSQIEFDIIQEVLHSLQGKFNERQLREESAKVISTARKEVILMYTAFFGDKNWFVKEVDKFLKTTHVGKCPFYQCEFTTDQNQFARSDAVIFHARDMPSLQELQNLQKTRPSHQRWIYFIMESPMYTPDPSPYNKMFNWTLTYRADSDLRFPYGNYYPRITPWKEEESLKKIVANKNKLVFWTASHCGLLRDKYVRKLKKYINVDVFGACGAALGGGSGSCAQDSKNCTEELQHYKFALAFENQMCEDYITEKYWKRLPLNVVPVVMGGSKYDSNIAVPGSYINAADFPTVQALANYLQYLDKNNTAYMEFFEWKKKYIFRSTLAYFSCALCVKLNLDQKPKVYERLDETWSKTKHCGTTDKMFNDIINRS